jgi:SEC-C motif-containing protein
MLNLKTNPLSNQACLCGSGLLYCDCCGVYHLAIKKPETAEALMRSRYSAYVLGLVEYLTLTWCQRKKPKVLSLADQPDWVRLEVVQTQQGQKNDRKGLVEFKAYYQTPQGLSALHETSRFERNPLGNWCYLDGKIH